MNTTHSPLPWKVAHTKQLEPFIVNSTGKLTIANSVNGGTMKEAEASAQFIVTACNSHAALLGALEALVGWAGFVVEDSQDLTGYELILKARQAIALAKGENK